MHIGLVSPEMTGHLNPSLALGREVARRGHRVSVFTAPRVRDKVERAGLGHVSIGEKEDADGLAVAAIERLGRMRGMAAAMYTGRLLRHAQDILLRDLPDALTRSGVEGLIVDQASPAGAVVAERLGLPYVVICNALAMCNDPALPPPALLWRYRKGSIWRMRNQLAATVLLTAFKPIAGVKRDGVSPLMLFFEYDRGLAVVAQQPAFFDFPRDALPDHFHYTGPWHEPERDDELTFPWDRLDGRPLVYASLGTLQNRMRRVYAAIAEAARGLDIQLVIALGSPTATLDIEPPENVIVVPYAPQLRLLDRAAVAITHCGLNTTLECLRRGVPMVCLPVTNDQPGVARRVEWIDAGEVLPVGRVTADRLRRHLAQVLSDPKYRDAAARCRDEMAAIDGAAQAADIIEQALTSGERVRTADRPEHVSPTHRRSETPPVPTAPAVR